MCSPAAFICDLYPANLEMSSFSTTQGVGIGLYLGLAAIQVVSAGGLANLRRRAARLHDAIELDALEQEQRGLRRIRSQIANTELRTQNSELRTQKLGKVLLAIVAVLVVASLAPLAYSTLAPQTQVNCAYGLAMLFGYLVLPVVLFSASYALLRRQHGPVLQDISACENRGLSAVAKAK